MAAAADDTDDNAVSVQKSDGAAADWARPCSLSIEEAPLHELLRRELLGAGFVRPSPVQRHVWPLATRGWDLIAIAKTGSGKTLAFLLPAFTEVLEERGEKGKGKGKGNGAPGAVRLLVLAPTRELATQIDESARRFGGPAGLRSAPVYGGVPRGPQLSELRRVRPHAIVACPGRLNDFLSWSQVDVSHVSHFVVDEADRLLDMGFEPQVREILGHLPPNRQSMLFSATWPESVQTLAKDLLRPDHLVVHVGASRELRANAAVAQTALVLPDVAAKEQALLEQLRALRAPDEKVLIFVNARDDVDRIYDFLRGSGVECACTHGLLDQAERERTLTDYRSGQVRILVATDLAARGLDIQGITVVINFDPPHSYKVEDYVHRIGRTGRAGKQGKSITLLLPVERNQAKAIADVMRSTGQAVSPEHEALASEARGSAKDRKAEKQREFRAAKQVQERQQRTTPSAAPRRDGGGDAAADAQG